MILEKIRETIKRYQMLDKGDSVVVAVSGGPDSITLLYILNVLRKEFKLKLHIAHLDHMLRPDSLEDRVFVEGLATKLKIPVTADAMDVKTLAKKGSIEEIGREARLDFLFRVAKEVKADKIALGHTQDDQSETILMRIIRGTGLYGLAGILPKRKIKSFEIIRPLIEISREEIMAFLKKKKFKARLDASNLEDIYFRNRIRNKLMPLLQAQYNSNIKEVLANMAHSSGTDYEYLQKQANAALKRLQNRTSQRPSEAKIALNLSGFLKLHPAIQRLVLRLTIRQVKGDTRRLTFKHIREIEDLVYNRPLNSVVNLPKGVYIVKKKRHLTVGIR